MKNQSRERREMQRLIVSSVSIATPTHTTELRDQGVEMQPRTRETHRCGAVHAKKLTHVNLRSLRLYRP